MHNKDKELWPSRAYLNNEKLLNFQKSMNVKVFEWDGVDSVLPAPP